MSYQNVIINGVENPGFTKSHVSWASIQQLGVSFFNRTVCDIGCFHGYFSFQIERCGASKVVGYEPNDEAREEAMKIKSATGFNTELIDREFGGDGFFDREFDVGVALNMLHWVREKVGLEQYKKTIDELCQYCICLVVEVNPEDFDIIKEIAEANGKVLAKQLPSHRHGRIIAYFAPWGNTKTINIKDIKDYTGKEIEVEPHNFEEDFDYLHNIARAWNGCGVVDDMMEVERHFFSTPAKNQPIHDLAMKYYMSPLKDTLRLIDAYNGIRAGIMLPPIGLKDGKCLHQGHTRIKAYKLHGMDDIDLRYYDREIYLKLSHREQFLGGAFLL